MRELTLGGFLKKYVNELSYQKSENLSRLAMEADTINPRLKEPLLLYAYFTKEPKTAKRQFSNSSLYKDYCEFLKNFPDTQAAIKYLSENSSLNNYRKVYKSYISKKNRYKAESKLKDSIRQEILMTLKEKGITAYEVIKVESLELNKGNFYAFLRGKSNSINTYSAYNVLKYLNELPN